MGYHFQEVDSKCTNTVKISQHNHFIELHCASRSKRISESFVWYILYNSIRKSTMIVRSTCLGLLTIIELDECCILLVEENLYTNYVAIHTYRWRIGVQSDSLCFMSGTHITHFIIEPVVAQCKVCDIMSFNFQKQKCTQSSRCKGDNLTTWIIQTSLCYNFAANEDTIGITKKIE